MGLDIAKYLFGIKFLFSLIKWSMYYPDNPEWTEEENLHLNKEILFKRIKRKKEFVFSLL